MNKIGDFKEQLKYVPTKLFFSEVDLDTPGFYTLNSEGSDSV
jgi:hypothetical protein